MNLPFPIALEFRQTFLNVFEYVMQNGYSSLQDPANYVFNKEGEALRTDIAMAISETFGTLGLLTPEVDNGLSTIHDWLDEAYPDIAKALSDTTDQVEEPAVSDKPAIEPRAHADDLTIAYIALGVGQAMRELPQHHLPSHISDRYSGQLGFVQAVIDHALLLDRLADEEAKRADGLKGVFVYEVAEPFGYQLAKRLLNSDPSARDVRELADELMRGMQW